MVSAFADTTFTFETVPAFNFKIILRWTINVRPMEGEDIIQSYVNNTASRKYSWWLKFRVFRQHIWKKFPSSKKAMEDIMAPTVNKCVKLKSKLQLKCFIFLKSIIYLDVNCIDQGQWPLNTTADFGGFPYWLSVTYWLAEWRWKGYLFLNSFIQMKYLLVQIKIIIISYSLTK